jgi:hypothetical protein
MSNQIQITSGAKVRNLEGVLTGSSGIMSSLPINTSLGIPQLDVNGKILVDQLPNSIMEYKGSWNAATNTPTLVNGTGNAGDVYLCEVAGTVNFGAGPITFAVGDQVIYSGTIWQRASGATGTVTSVAVTESGDALTITGSPITTSGTINIGFAGTSGQYINGAGGLTTFPSLTGFVPYTGATGDVNLGLFSIISNRVSAIGDNSTYGGTLSIKQNNVRSLLGTGYTELFGKTNLLGISFGVGSIANLSNSVLTAERTFTLPDLSGTLALLEGTQTFSGAKTFDAAYFNGAEFNNTAYFNEGLWLVKNGVPIVYTALQTTIYSEATTNNVVFRDNASKAKLEFNNSTQTYTFPAASGTVALTSNLSSYVPYTGATGAVNLGAFDLTVNGVKIGIGAGSLTSNTILGAGSLGLNTTGYENTAVGYATLYSNTIGYDNVGVGYASLNLNTTGTYNTSIGSRSLFSNTTGNNNTAIGNISLNLNTTGSNNIAIGGNALANNTTSSNNTAVGYVSLGQNITGTQNSALGANSLTLNTIGSNNIAIGYTSLNANTTGSQNTSIGVAALTLHTTGTYNTAIGYGAGGSITTGSNNTIVGYYAGTATMSNNIVLADGAGNVRYQFDGTNNIFTSNLNGTSASFASSGGSDTFTINHSSGSGIALNITKGGNGEGLYINKTSGSGNALTVIGSTSLGALSGTSATFASTAFTNLTLNGTNANGWGNNMAFQSGGTDFGYVGSIGSLLGNTTKDMTIWATSGNGFRVYTNGNNKQLEITTTGAATFSGTLETGTASTANHIKINENQIQRLGGLTLFLNADQTGNVSIVEGGGKVGIGTSSPARQLEIYSTTDAYMKFNGQRAGINAFTIGNDNSGFIVYDDTNGTYRLKIANNTGAVTLSNLGTGAVTATSGVLSTTSDMNLKIEDGYIDTALDKILKLTPRYFYWKEESGLPTDLRQLGFYAQEVNEALGEEVANTPKTENDKWGIYDRGIIAMLTKAIQEQQAQIEELKAMILAK